MNQFVQKKFTKEYKVQQGLTEAARCAALPAGGGRDVHALAFRCRVVATQRRHAKMLPACARTRPKWLTSNNRRL
eukprot:357826-Chlamydomonas_euryale.AAC.5